MVIDAVVLQSLIYTKSGTIKKPVNFIENLILIKKRVLQGKLRAESCFPS